MNESSNKSPKPENIGNSVQAITEFLVVYYKIKKNNGEKLADSIYDKLFSNQKFNIEKIGMLPLTLEYAGYLDSIIGKKLFQNTIQKLSQYIIWFITDNIGEKPDLPNCYVLTTDSKIVRYNREENGVYYNDEHNICVENGKIKHFIKKYNNLFTHIKDISSREN